MIQRFIALCLVLLGTTIVSADPLFERRFRPGRVHANFEMFLRPASLTGLMPFFDFSVLAPANVIQNTRHSPAEWKRMFNRYLDSRSDLFWRLPQDLQSTLAHGLDMRKQFVWGEIESRWRKLTLQEQAAAADWNELHVATQAMIFHANSETRLELLPFAPEVLRRLMERIQWRTEGDTVAFSYADEMRQSNFKQLHTDIMALAGFTDQRVARFLTDPYDSMLGEFKWGRLSLHFISENRSLEHLAAPLNQWLFLIRLNHGMNADLHRDSEVRFHSDVTQPGLVTLADTNHLEVRAFPLAVIDVIRFVTPLLAMPEQEAAKKLRQSVQPMITADVLVTTLRLLPEFAFQLRNFRLANDAAPDVWNALLLHAAPQGPYFKQAARIITDYFAAGNTTYPEPVWDHIRNLLAGSPDEIERAISACRLSPQPPDDIWMSLLDIFKREAPQRLGTDIGDMVFSFFTQRESWPQPVWHALIEILKNESRRSRLHLETHVLIRLRDQKQWPKEVSRLLSRNRAGKSTDNGCSDIVDE